MTVHFGPAFVPAEWRKPRVRWAPELKPILSAAQDRHCAICGLPMPDLAEANFDHVRPLCRGGKDALGNLVLVHRPCNSAKATRWPTGCELIFVCLVNEALGLWERPAIRTAA